VEKDEAEVEAETETARNEPEKLDDQR